MRRIIISPHGGLGNILFQVAAVLYMSEKIDKTPALASRRLRRYKDHSTITSLRFCEQFLPTPCSKIYDTYISHKILMKIEFLKERFVVNPDLQNIKKSMFYMPDYYQFSEIALQFKDRFYKKLTELNNENLRTELPDNYVGIHVRRGDYFNVKNIEKYGICTEYYYNTAIKYLKKKNNDIRIHIFSDDIQWCRDNIDNVDKFQVGQSELTDILLLSNYKIKILSNSTFSAWSGYFSPPGSQIFVPEYWKKDVKSIDTGILERSWIVI